MHYVYLPTSWCRKYKISSTSKVSVELNSDGTLSLYPHVVRKKGKEINLAVSEDNPELIMKLIMACYLNPSSSFKIRLEKKTDVARIMDQKKTISGFEFVELDGNHITYESSMSINEPDSLLKTLVKKISNLLGVMISNYSKELVMKFEEEIDRSKILIDKSVTEMLTSNQPSLFKPIDLHYMALIAQHLERAVDFLILLEENEKPFFKEVLGIIGDIKEITENLDSLDYEKAISLNKNIIALKQIRIQDVPSSDKRRIRDNLVSVGDVLMDWAINRYVEKTK